MLQRIFLIVLALGRFVAAQNGAFLALYPCSDDSDIREKQQWVINIGGNYSTIQLKNESFCFDCNGCKGGATPYPNDCDPNPDSNRNSYQWWSFIDSTNKVTTNLSLDNIEIQSYLTSTSCITVIDSSFVMKECSRNSGQLFKYNSDTTQLLFYANESMCVTREAQANCSISPYSTYPYCDQGIDNSVLVYGYCAWLLAFLALPIPTRVKDLVSRMTIGEKVNNLINSNIGVARLGVPPNQFTEALHGVWTTCGAQTGNNTGCPTSFPHPLLMSASFNRTLWQTVAKMISTEARGLHNQGIAGLYFWAPDINLFRDPRWGRGQEVPGEDPFLTSQYVMEYSHNMQFSEDSSYLKVVSTAKHYCDYDQEGNWGTDRASFDANVTQQDQVEYYWPAWRSAIQSGNVQSIMCAYNAVNGIPNCGNDYFMNEIARQEYGFDGYFVSDCGAISDGAFTKYIKKTYNNSVNNSTDLNYLQAKTAIEAGCDVECGTFYGKYLEGAYDASYVSEDTIDRSVGRLYTRMFELGIMDDPSTQYFNTLGAQNVDTMEHREVALDAARQSIVLLKNDNNMLPLSLTSGNLKSIAMIGPHANSTQVMLSSYHGTNTLVNSHSPYQAFSKNVGSSVTVTYAIGCETVNCSSTVGFDAAKTAAQDADVALVFLGLCANAQPKSAHCNGLAYEGEGHDRINISFPGYQLELLQEVASVQDKVILVLINGGIIDITWPKVNTPAIIESFYPGELGGDALYDIIFGNVSPAGKLPVTIYDVSLIKNRPTIADMNLRDNGGITYRYYQGTPLYWFGYGLSYTNFTYKWMNQTLNFDSDSKLYKQTISTYDMAKHYYNQEYFASGVSFYVSVTNIGEMASDCVVLGFLSSNHSDAPINKKLFDFQRVFINPGQTVNVTLSVSPESISLTDIHGHERILQGKYKIMIGESGNDNYVIGELEMIGKDQTLFDLRKVKQRWQKKHNRKLKY